MTTGQLGAIVLCGGRSRRMRKDKASLPFGPETLLERVIRLTGQVASPVVVAAGPDQIVPPGARVSRDPEADQGPLPAMLHALDQVQAEFVFVVACDTPLLQPPLVQRLADLCGDHDGAVPCVNGRVAATCAVYRTAALRHARTRFGNPGHRSLQAFLALLSVRSVPPEALLDVDPHLLSFLPCNTPTEYAAALRVAHGGLRTPDSGL